MTMLLVTRWVHLVAVATWTGGLIVLAALVVALRRAGADRELLRAAARQFGRVSWAAMAVAVLTGVAQVWLLGWPWTYEVRYLDATLSWDWQDGHGALEKASPAALLEAIETCILGIDGYDLYLIAGASGHCLALTSDLASATGVLLAARVDEE